MDESLSAADRDAICETMLREHLPRLGMSESGPRRWIDGTKPPARRLFELKLTKGGALKACWGLSLDFVPHLSGGTFRWHRSDKSAVLDVIVDPNELPRPCYLYGAKRFQSELAELLVRAVPAAARDWSRGATLEGVLAIVRSIRDENTNCFGFRHYTQLPLALMFLAAKTGDAATSERELVEYERGGWISDAAIEQLRKLLSECGRSN